MLLDAEKERRRTLKRAENTRKKRWRRKKTRERFYQDPFKTVKDVLSPKTNVQPDVSVEKLNKYVEEVVSDTYRDIPLGPLEGLPEKCPTITKFLFKICKSVVTSGKVPLKWRISDGILIPKVDNPVTTEIEGQFRQIALMNVEAKLFW